MQVKIKVAGNDLSSYALEDTLFIESVITHAIDTCELTIEDKTGSVSINELDEIIISNMAETVRYFAGYIVDIARDVAGITKVFGCCAQDYTMLLDTPLVNKIYEDKTDKEIIQDLFAVYLPEIDTNTYVNDGLTNVKIAFNRIKLREAIDKLSANSGYDWYVDYDKKLHYFDIGANNAPFELSDNPDNVISFPYSQFVYSRDVTQIINAVIVEGGTYLSDDMTFYLAANGVATELPTPYKMHKPATDDKLLVYKNTGSDESPEWAAQVVGADYLDSLGANSINKVTVYARAMAIAGATVDRTSLKIAIKSGTGSGAPDTVSEGDEETLTAGVWLNFSYQWSTNPATGSAWTWNEIVKLQIGIALRQCAPALPRGSLVTQVYVEVDGTTKWIFRPNAAGDETNLVIGGSSPAPTNWESVDEVTSDESITSVARWAGDAFVRDLYNITDPYNCLHNYQEKLLKFATAPPDLKKSVKIVGRYDVPILLKVKSQASYDTYGRWFEHKVIDSSIDNKEWAKLVAKGILAEDAFVKERGSLICDKDGLTSGMTVKIVNALRGVDGNYTINRLTTRILGGEYCQYELEFGEYNPDLIDLLLKIKHELAENKRRIGEVPVDITVLMELLEHQEALALAEATDRHEYATPASVWIALPPTQSAGHHVNHELLALAEAPSRWEQLKGQYCWAPKTNGVGLREARWNFFTWG